MSTTTPDDDSDSSDTITTTFEVGERRFIYGPISLGRADETALRFVHTHFYVTDLLELVADVEAARDEWYVAFTEEMRAISDWVDSSLD